MSAVFGRTNIYGSDHFALLCRNVRRLLGEEVLWHICYGSICVDYITYDIDYGVVERDFHSALKSGWIDWGRFGRYLFPDSDPGACILFASRIPVEYCFNEISYFKTGVPSGVDFSIHVFDNSYLDVFSGNEELIKSLCSGSEWIDASFPGIMGDAILHNEEMTEAVFGKDWKERLNVLTPLPSDPSP